MATEDDMETAEKVLFSSEDQPSEEVDVEVLDGDLPVMEPVGEPVTTEEENPDADLSVQKLEQKYGKDVRTTGLDVNFIAGAQCPICGFRTKDALQLTVTKNRLFQKKTPANPVVGIATMCVNCGHIDFYGTSIENILYYLRGRGDKCCIGESGEEQGGNTDT